MRVRKNHTTVKLAGSGKSPSKGLRNSHGISVSSARSQGSPLQSARPFQHTKAKPFAGQQSSSFPIVGVGASAGGLEAFTSLVKHLPADTGMAFVLIQHLDPSHQSALAQLLSKATAMPVQEVRNGMPLEPNHIYVIPPNAQMTVAQSVLKLVKGARKPGAQHSIDEFLESLAKDRGPQAIGVILSGSASDGMLGLTAIKAEGGITFAQDASAEYESMPRSAIDSGCVDFMLSPAQIARELARIARHPRLFLLETEDSEDSAQEQGEYRKVLHLLQMRSGVDLTLYKSATIKRRIARRMLLKKVPQRSAYLKYLRDHTQEIDDLLQDALITVTGFFREPDVFERLKQTVFPALARNRRLNRQVRVWVPGCSSGQEVYSLAMAFHEFAADVANTPRWACHCPKERRADGRQRWRPIRAR